MFTEIITAIRGEIIRELEKRVKKSDSFIFRSVDEDGEEKIYCDLAVGHPSAEDGYYPDVVKVYGATNGVRIIVRDEDGWDLNLEIRDKELDVSDLAAILDAIIDGKPVIE